MTSSKSSEGALAWKLEPQPVPKSVHAVSEPTRDDVARALQGGESAFERLVDQLMPVIHVRLARTLLRFGVGEGQLHQEVEDLTQEVFVGLLAEGGKVLRGWDPRQGMSLLNYVGLIAERRAAAAIRRKQRTAGVGLFESGEQEAPDADPEEEAISRQRLRQLTLRLRVELSPLGWRLFELLFVEDLPVREICRRMDLSPEAVYAWRSRLRKLARRLVDEAALPVDDISTGGR